MSVLIKGMDMPKQGCYKCLAREGNWCSLLPDVPYREIIACANKEQRHENCPLVGVHNEPWKKWSGANKVKEHTGTTIEREDEA